MVRRGRMGRPTKNCAGWPDWALPLPRRAFGDALGVGQVEYMQADADIVIICQPPERVSGFQPP